MKLLSLLLLALVALFAFAGSAFATPPAGLDFSTLTGAVDATAIVAGLLAIGAVLVLPKVAAWGVRTIKGLIR